MEQKFFLSLSCYFLSLLRGQKLRAVDLGPGVGVRGRGQLAFDWAGHSQTSPWTIVSHAESSGANYTVSRATSASHGFYHQSL